MSAPIYTQYLGVWYSQNANGFQTITYNPQAVAPDQPLMPAVRRRTDWSKVTQSITQLQFQIQDLLGRAVYDKARGTAGVEKAVQALSTYVLPPDGFASLLQPGAQPCLDISGDDAAFIPWEALEERYFSCPKCGHHTNPFKPPPSLPVFCENDGTQMEATGGKLALTYRFTHVVRCRGTCVSGGRTFLLVKDPCGDLCTRDGKPVSGVDDHIDTLEALLKDNGYKVKTLANSMATCDRVLKWIAKPDLAGIYYFGHGLLQSDTGESSLVLHDGRLKARDIEEAGSTAAFVFLNACEAGAVPLGNSVEDGLSIASAFAVGGANRAVVAPIFPIETRQGAQAALAFFKSAVAEGSTAADSLQSVRHESLKAYEADLPDVRWLSYRYFGDPNIRLSPGQRPATVPAESKKERHVRVFDENDHIQESLFAFPIDDILLRAAKRRNLQDRKLVDAGDLIAGIIRKGELTRFALDSLGLDPDALYAEVLSCEDSESSADEGSEQKNDSSWSALDYIADGEDALSQLMARFIVRLKSEFTQEAITALTEADSRAQQRDADDESCAITEQEFLEQLMLTRQWKALQSAGLPKRESVVGVLASRESAGIDANGIVLLDNLDMGARRVIYDALTLAQQRGVFPINNRVMLAALLERNDGYASRVCRAGGVPIPPSTLRQTIRAAIDENGEDQDFGLSRKACSRIVSAVLEEAARAVGSTGTVSERDIFRAYCEKAAPGLKMALKQSLHLDLDHLKTLEPAPEGSDEQVEVADLEVDQRHAGPSTRAPDLEGFDETCKRIIDKATEYARASGNNSVNSPHLFAAIVEGGKTSLASLLGEHPEKAKKLREMALSVMRNNAGRLGDDVEMVFSPHTLEILDRAKLVAEASNHKHITEDDLLVSFFADGGGVIGRMLTMLGLQAALSSDIPPTSPDTPMFGLN